MWHLLLVGIFSTKRSKNSTKFITIKKNKLPLTKFFQTTYFMNLKKILLASACILAVNAAFSQQFLEGFQLVSKGKPAYVTLMTGEKLEGHIKDVDWRKGLYESIVFVDNNGKESNLMAKDIQTLYAQPAGMEKLAKRMEFGSNVHKATSKDYNFDLLGQGMMILEQTDVLIKNKKQFNLLMQLLNPDFCSEIKVYRDPIVEETTKWGVAGITLAGGDIKTYYVKKGTAPAYRVEKSDYKKEFAKLFGDNAEMTRKYGEKPSWYDFAKHIDEYTKAKL